MEKWEYKEPTDEEFNEMRKNNTFYRIYFEDEDGKDYTVYKFWALNDDEALEMLDTYKSDFFGDNRTYYLGTSGYYIDSNGNRFDTMQELNENVFSEEDALECDLDEIDRYEKYGGAERAKEAISNIKRQISKLYSQIEKLEKCSDILAAKPENEKEFSREEISNKTTAKCEADDLCTDLENAAGHLKDGHAQYEHWNLDSHILVDLMYNIPLIMKNKDGVPVQIGEEFNISDVDKAADKWNEMLAELLENIYEYLYYSEFGIDDGTLPKNWVEKHIDDIPYKPGTKKEIDYKKLGEMSLKAWNFIWDWMKKYGNGLWD